MRRRSAAAPVKVRPRLCYGFGGVVESEGGVVVESAGGGDSDGVGVDSGVAGGAVSEGVVGLAGLAC